MPIALAMLVSGVWLIVTGYKGWTLTELFDPDRPGSRPFAGSASGASPLALPAGGTAALGTVGQKVDPGGESWGGSRAVARRLADVAMSASPSIRIVSEKRGRRGTASGGVSDHWVGSKNAYAYDLSDGTRPTPGMDRAAVAIARALGKDYDGKSTLNLTTTVDGFRVQVLYRTWIGGNHYNHIHVGVRRV